MKQLTIILNENDDGEKTVDILYSGYNIINETIYDEKTVDKILTILRGETQKGLEWDTGKGF